MEIESTTFEAGAPAVGGPTGHRGPRRTILVSLKARGDVSAAELAEQLGCSLNAVRHHLKELESDGAIEYDSTPQAAGAPVHRWHLTERGHQLFPARYEQTLLGLLDHLVATEGRQAAVDLLVGQYRSLAERLDAETRGMTPIERGRVVARVLDAEGYMATWKHAAEGGLLTEYNCPHRLIAERFPEVCQAEERFLGEVFGVPVERRSHIDAGCGTCSYRVATGDATEDEEER